MTLTHPLDRDLAKSALNAHDRYVYWLRLARFWRRRGARNAARSCVRYASEERTLFNDLLIAAEAES